MAFSGCTRVIITSAIPVFIIDNDKQGWFESSYLQMCVFLERRPCICRCINPEVSKEENYMCSRTVNVFFPDVNVQTSSKRNPCGNASSKRFTYIFREFGTENQPQFKFTSKT